MSADKPTCAGAIWTGYHRKLCGLSAKHEHDGKWYCKTHHPPTVAAKTAARDAEYRRRFDERERILKAAESAHKERDRRAGLHSELLAELRAARDYLSCIPESAAGGDDDAVRLTKRLDAVIAKATGEVS
jgi:hypothetical protein